MISTLNSIMSMMTSDIFRVTGKAWRYTPKNDMIRINATTALYEILFSLFPFFGFLSGVQRRSIRIAVDMKLLGLFHS